MVKKILVPTRPLKERRLKRLLGRGYFPTELPPTFTTEDFANSTTKLRSAWDVEKILAFRTKPEHYSIPRYGHARRSLSIVNPVNQFAVAKIIADNWPDIEKRLKRSSTSEFKPAILLSGPGRSVTGVDFDAVARRRSKILGLYGRYVKTDVTRFFPSIYTHSIAWSLVGKEFAKKNYNKPAFKGHFGNQLDRAIGAGQEGQTVGIPIGPDTSRIVSELIAAEIEQIAKQTIPDLNDRSVRYVDDFIIGLREDETESAVLVGIANALYEYELELSAEKTDTHGMGCKHAPEWVSFIRNFEPSPGTRQRDDLDSFFEHALYLADENSKEHVLLFAAKRAVSFSVQTTNTAHLFRWLLYCARRSPSCLRFVAEHLAAIRADKVTDKGEIADFILQQVPVKAEAAHTDEVAWLLFWAREIGLKLDAGLFDRVRPLRSSAVGLLTLDLNDRGLISGKLKVPEWKAFATQDGLKSEMWLLAYEATLKGWWPGSVKSSFVSGHPYFGTLWSEKVEFYDPKKTSKAATTPSRMVFRASPSSDYGDEYI
ncbi:RNA-directed DNA polymerase [Brevundimonas sp.]|uniref:RNA-directed DNA polymerase n=1 Tax=Brevundimonas sp. TaxID=1871086 RepID=UPI0035ADAF6E